MPNGGGNGRMPAGFIPKDGGGNPGGKPGKNGGGNEPGKGLGIATAAVD